MTNPADQTYRIHLPQFEGPFDLLLFFIERDELDIHDIPIAKITKDFLGYMQQMREMNIELAAEFILVASTLMRIKAKMLLPRPVLDEKGEEIDPRAELVARLIEYKKYKSVVDDMAQMEFDQAQREVRQFGKQEEKLFLQSEFPEEELVGMDLYRIMRTYKRIWERHHEKLQKPQHVIRRYPYNVEEVKGRLLEEVEEADRIDFVSFVLQESERIFMVFAFLAILELVASQKLALTLGTGYNNFWIEKKVVEPSDEDETVAEDWDEDESLNEPEKEA
ncbi:ScpA family protein [Pontibacter sp. G13]|uniref:segregation and condensation protein A n=1 Tax=Pontibacter sp. G13 TaxID=3074898 RepID=UPI00288B6ADE|nr:ScpA family protein [Pontibacter sp. G13]WNJ16016.1 ScpA family protein [Pontibacter sp. G13]